MDIRAIKIFNHLAHSLHFGRSSRACNLSPSALTRTIQRIEEELGKPLFQRDNRKVSLTPAGVVFKQYAEEMEQRWQLLLQELGDDARLHGEISLYCSVTAATSILPRILGAFRQNHPGVQIKLQTGDAAEALDRLNDRDAQITIAALPEQLPDSVSFVELARTPLLFIAPREAGLPMVDAKGAIDWHRTPVILAEQGLSRIRIDRWFKEKNIHPNIYAEVAGNEALLAMVGLGCGVGVVPELVLEKSPLRERVHITPITPELAPFIIGACTLTRHLDHPVIQAFWITVQQVKASEN
ncbi:MAG: HTH-type transcriptional activator IlvY [Desulfobulbus sp.]|nr:HTH-type transcriptional activator IlvY [Desulfobulbus sp.]